MPATIHSEPVTYRAGDTTLRGFLATTATHDARPGVLVVHEWWGLNDYIRRRARMLAELGYTALAVDMYGDGRVADNAAEAGALMTAVVNDRKAAEARFAAGFDLLKAQPGTDGNRHRGHRPPFGAARRPARGAAGPSCAASSATARSDDAHVSAGRCSREDSSVTAPPTPGPDGMTCGVQADGPGTPVTDRHVRQRPAASNPDADTNGKKRPASFGVRRGGRSRSWQDMREFLTRIFA
jgi:hypothetical protein